METDRSRIIAYQTCPRQRYLGYHVGGTGLQRTRKSLPLQFGSAFHEGSEALLSPSNYPSPTIEKAVRRAHQFLEEQFDNHAIGFDGELPADTEAAMAYGREEQMALAEALLRAWWAYEGETFLETFEVIEVEREGRSTLTSTPAQDPYGADAMENGCKMDDLILMFRPDALVRDKLSGDLYVVSWKTCATFGKRNTDQARHDQQSISEVWGILNSREHSFTNDFYCEGSTRPRIEGVLYKWIVKGRRSLDKWDGLYKQNTHLIYGWVKLNTLESEFPEWSWSYEYEDEQGKTKRLGTGWQKRPVWRDYPGGVKQWIDDLAHSRVFPRHMDALAQVFPQALPVERRADEVESWLEQTVAQEQRIPVYVYFVNNAESENERRWALNTYFPQSTHSCHSYSGCPFIPICWEGVKAEPGELYQIRLANHPEKGDDE